MNYELSGRPTDIVVRGRRRPKHRAPTALGQTLNTFAAMGVALLVSLAGAQFLLVNTPAPRETAWTAGTVVDAGSYPGAPEAANRFAGLLTRGDHAAIYAGLHSTARAQVGAREFASASACAGKRAPVSGAVRVLRVEVHRHMAVVSYTWNVYRDRGVYRSRELHGLYQLMWWEDGAWRWTTTASLDDRLSEWAAKTSAPCREGART